MELFSVPLWICVKSSGEITCRYTLVHYCSDRKSDFLLQKLSSNSCYLTIPITFTDVIHFVEIKVSS